MPTWLRQSTAVNVRLGPFVDDTDGKTAETGLTIAQADVRLSKNGGAAAQKNDASSCTHDENGYYTCPLDSTDTNTLGRLTIMVSESGALPLWHEYMVVPANVYDSIVSGTDKLDANAAELGGVSQTGRDVGASVLLSSGTGIGQINLSSGAVALQPDQDVRNVTGNVTGSVGSVANYGSLVADVATAVWAAGTRTLTSFGTLIADIWSYAARTLTAISDSAGVTTLLSRILGTLAAGTHNPQSGDAYALIGAGGAGLTALGDARLANLDAAISSREASGAAAAAVAGIPEAVDAELSVSHGSGLWGEAEASGANSLTITVTDADTELALPGVLITIKNSDDTAIVHQGRTDTQGQAVASLDDGSYRIHASAIPGYGSAIVPQDVSENTDVAIALTPIQASAPSAPGLCVVYCYAYRNGTPQAGMTLAATLQDRNSATDGVLLSRQVTTATTDADGYAELQLVQGSQFTHGSGVYRIELTDAYGEQVAAYEGVIPDVASRNLEDMLT